jgi:hypothetical protein
MACGLGEQVLLPSAGDLVPFSWVVSLLLQRPVHYIVVEARAAQQEAWWASSGHDVRASDELQQAPAADLQQNCGGVAEGLRHDVHGLDVEHGVCRQHAPGEWRADETEREASSLGSGGGNAAAPLRGNVAAVRPRSAADAVQPGLQQMEVLLEHLKAAVAAQPPSTCQRGRVKESSPPSHMTGNVQVPVEALPPLAKREHVDDHPLHVDHGERLGGGARASHQKVALCSGSGGSAAGLVC